MPSYKKIRLKLSSPLAKAHFKSKHMYIYVCIEKERQSSVSVTFSKEGESERLSDRVLALFRSVSRT